MYVWNNMFYYFSTTFLSQYARWIWRGKYEYLWINRSTCGIRAFIHRYAHNCISRPLRQSNRWWSLRSASREVFFSVGCANVEVTRNKTSVARSSRSWLEPRRKGSCSTTVAFTVYTIPNPISSLRIFQRTSQLSEECHDCRARSSPILENEITITRDFVARYTILCHPPFFPSSLFLSLSTCLSLFHPTFILRLSAWDS